MIRTVICFIYFWLYLLFTLPELCWVKYLRWRGRQAERERIIFSRAGKWARSLIRMAGGEIIITGQENVPMSGPVLFIVNHQGYFDIPGLLGFIAKPKAFLAKAELKIVPILSSWMKEMNCVFIKRERLKQSRSALEHCARLLKESLSLVVFPEGTRSKSSRLGEFKTGAFKLALQTGVPIVPVALDGTYKLLEQQGWLLRPATIQVRIAPPVLPVKDTDPRELTAKIRQIIAENLQEPSNT